MADLTYPVFFESLVKASPYPYQTRLGTEGWPDLVDIPTGMGKSAAVVVAWLWKRLHKDSDTPRRLVYCLPMRVLVDQTLANVEGWLEAARPFFERTGVDLPRQFGLLGGRSDDDWARDPERAALLVGTQDMLLSRALMRGYGTSRYRWPIDFGLLHNDALWVFDEVQLMGPGLATSAQLEGFRRADVSPPARPTRSLWLSATLRHQWLQTVDLAAHVPSLRTCRLSEEERQSAPVRRRIEAFKALEPAPLKLASTKKDDLQSYADALGTLVLARHDGSAPTLVVLNSVERTQEVARRILDEARGAEVLVVHARFRQQERAALNDRIRRMKPGDDVIVVATQAVEAGVDLTSRTLITELAPWPSMIQRFGRCNRGGEYDDASVLWVDVETDSDDAPALPYTPPELLESRTILRELRSVASSRLPGSGAAAPGGKVLRRRDFEELFNTDPDLSGFDVDISPYIRDAGTPQVQVFWREFHEAPREQKPPSPNELCPVSMGQIGTHLRKKGVTAYRYDHLEPDPERRWRRVGREGARPGEVLLLRRRDGGYDRRLGFVPRHADAPTIPTADSEHTDVGGMPDEPGTVIGRFVSLADHLDDAAQEASNVCNALQEPLHNTIVQVLRWHDVGKAHPAFQRALLAQAHNGGVSSGTLWAKSSGTGRLEYAVEQNGQLQKRKHFRHELASVLAWLEHGEAGDEHDLTAYLIGAHHGKVRMGIRTLPGESDPGDGRLFACGVWEGDILPAIEGAGVSLPEIPLRLDVIQLGEGEMGPSWAARTRRLLAEHGPFRLAWLEALVRIADWRASRNEATAAVEEP